MAEELNICNVIYAIRGLRWRVKGYGLTLVGGGVGKGKRTKEGLQGRLEKGLVVGGVWKNIFGENNQGFQKLPQRPPFVVRKSGAMREQRNRQRPGRLGREERKKERQLGEKKAEPLQENFKESERRKLGGHVSAKTRKWGNAGENLKEKKRRVRGGLPG